MQYYDATFGQRQRGTGLWSDLLAQRFAKACQRLQLNRERFALDFSRFQPPPRMASKACSAATSFEHVKRSLVSGGLYLHHPQHGVEQVVMAPSLIG